MPAGRSNRDAGPPCQLVDPSAETERRARPGVANQPVDCWSAGQLLWRESLRRAERVVGLLMLVPLEIRGRNVDEKAGSPLCDGDPGELDAFRALEGIASVAKGGRHVDLVKPNIRRAKRRPPKVAVSS